MRFSRHLCPSRNLTRSRHRHCMLRRYPLRRLQHPLLRQGGRYWPGRRHRYTGTTAQDCRLNIMGQGRLPLGARLLSARGPRGRLREPGTRGQGQGSPGRPGAGRQSRGEEPRGRAGNQGAAQLRTRAHNSRCAEVYVSVELGGSAGCGFPFGHDERAEEVEAAV